MVAACFKYPRINTIVFLFNFNQVLVPFGNPFMLNSCIIYLFLYKLE